MRRKRVSLITFLLLIALVVSTGLWLHAQQRQYALNRQLILALVHDDDKQALTLVNEGADPNTRYKLAPVPTLRALIRQLFHRSPTPANDSPIAFMIACGAWLKQVHRMLREVSHARQNPFEQDSGSIALFEQDANLLVALCS